MTCARALLLSCDVRPRAGNQLFVLPKTAGYKSLWWSMGQVGGGHL